MNSLEAVIQPLRPDDPTENQLQHFYELEDQLREYSKLRAPVAFKDAYDHCLRGSTEEDLAVLFLFVLNQCAHRQIDLQLMVTKLIKYAAITKAKHLNGLYPDSHPTRNNGTTTSFRVGEAVEVIRSRHDPMPLSSDTGVESMFGVSINTMGGDGGDDRSFTNFRSAINEGE